MTFHQAIYQKYGIKVTRDPVTRNKSPEQNNLETALFRAIQSSSVTIQTVQAIENAIDKYPDSEALKNHLYIAYRKTNQMEKAMDCLYNINKKHPNYAFGIINLVNHYLEKGNIEQAAQYINEPYDVYRIEQEDFIHHTVFTSYYQAVVRLALAKNDQKTAEKYHRLMFEYDPTDKITQKLSELILQGRIDNIKSRMIAPSVRKVVALPKSITGWETTNTPPVFIHPEVQLLYLYDALDSMPKQMESLLNLPRETFIQDLENVLADMIRRRDYYLSIKEWDEEKMSFSYHALYFLSELRAYDSLPTILNILRQDEEFLEYWFADALHDIFKPVLYLLGHSQLPVLQAFITEPNVHCSARYLSAIVASQVALRQPERRDEVIQWLKEVIQTHLDQPDNDELIDNFVLGDLVVASLNINAKELESEITQLFENGWIPPMICGDLDVVKHELHNRDTYRQWIDPLPNSIYEMYSGKYSDVIINPKREELRKKYLDNVENDPYSLFLTNRTFGQSLKEKMASELDDDDDERYYKQQETVRRVEPKIGRNDPCHCGSGKKYKKCHGA